MSCAIGIDGEALTRFYDVHLFPPVVCCQKITKPIDGIVGTRGHMTEGSPMVGQHDARSKGVEQRQCVCAREMTFSK